MKTKTALRISIALFLSLFLANCKPKSKDGGGWDSGQRVDGPSAPTNPPPSSDPPQNSAPPIKSVDYTYELRNEFVRNGLDEPFLSSEKIEIFSEIYIDPVAVTKSICEKNATDYIPMLYKGLNLTYVKVFWGFVENSNGKFIPEFYSRIDLVVKPKKTYRNVVCGKVQRIHQKKIIVKNEI